MFRPRSDTWLLAGALRDRPELPGGAVLDVCTGSGALAIAAALGGARSVTAVDVSRRAVAPPGSTRGSTASASTRGGGACSPPCPVAVRRDRVQPALPSRRGASAPRAARHTEAGATGRAARPPDRRRPGHLRPGGVLLVTHSSVNGEAATLARMRAAGLCAEVVCRRHGALGPLLAARAPALEARGLLPPGARDEELLVVAGAR